MRADDPNLILGGHEYLDTGATQFPSYPANNFRNRGLLRSYLDAAYQESPRHSGGPMEVHATEDIMSIQLTIQPPPSTAVLTALQLYGGSANAAGGQPSVVRGTGT